MCASLYFYNANSASSFYLDLYNHIWFTVVKRKKLKTFFIVYGFINGDVRYVFLFCLGQDKWLSLENVLSQLRLRQDKVFNP